MSTPRTKRRKTTEDGRVTETRRVRQPHAKSVSFRPGEVLFDELAARARPGVPLSEIAKRDLLRYYRMSGVPGAVSDEDAKLIAKAVRGTEAEWKADADAVVQQAVATYRGFDTDERLRLMNVVAKITVDDAGALLGWCEMAASAGA